MVFILIVKIPAQIIYVPVNYANIQLAINNASDGDTIIIADGIYSGDGNYNISWDATVKHLVIKSLNGPNDCIIDCNFLGRGFILNSGQNELDILDGITIRNGFAEQIGGGAILCDATSPQIINCILINNVAGGDSIRSSGYFADGGAIDCVSSSPIIKNNIIMNNCANHTGGGIHFLNKSSGIVENNIIKNNLNLGCYGGGGIALFLESYPLIINNLISNNNARYYGLGGYGGGIICMNSNPRIINNTIVNNTTRNNDLLGEGGGIRVRGLPSPIIINCIIWNNEAKDSLENLDFQTYGWNWTLDVSYSNIENGIYNIISTSPETIMNINPNFIDPQNGNFQLRSDSPCIDAGIPDSTGLFLPLYDLFGNNRVHNNRIDMGAYEFIIPTRINDDHSPMINYRLSQNYPNPFNPTTKISYSLPKSSLVQLKIFNLLGQEIATLVNEEKPAGNYEVNFNASNLPSGVYLYKIQAGDYIETKKMILLK
jgi:hypothetical protein